MQKTALDGPSSHVLNFYRRRNRLSAQMLRVMRMLLFLLFIACLTASATGRAQSITVSGKALTYKQVFAVIKKQTGFVVFYDAELFAGNKIISIHAEDLPLPAFLGMILKGEPLTYTIEAKTIFVAPLPDRIPAKESRIQLYTPTPPPIKIIVHDSTGAPLAGASVLNKTTGKSGHTDAEGVLSLPVSEGDIIQISYVGLSTQRVAITQSVINGTRLVVTLQPEMTEMKEVEVLVNTGFQKVPKERATGSFSFVSNKLFNQQVTTGIMERLPSIANGITVNRGTTEGEGQIMIRGLSTIHGPKAPLIVIDNFPYDGELNNINPNIVENISLLKDAAAASIWGARAANGVIVITTKTGRFNESLKVDITANTTIAGKPDLYYQKKISSSDFIELEQELFKRGFYNSDLNATDHPVLSPVVSLLSNAATIGEEKVMQEINRLKQIDSRDQFLRYMYRPMINQQYFINLRGGTSDYFWTSAVGFDHNTGNLQEKYQRLNLRFENTYQPIKRLSVTAGIYYTQTLTQSGRSGYGSVAMKGNYAVPYMEMADENGRPLAVASVLNQTYKDTAGNGKLLDWNYYPLTDWQHNTNKSNMANILARASASYRIIDGLSADIRYQYERQSDITNELHDEQSLYARHYINNFAQYQSDGSVKFIVPKGGILDKTHSMMQSNNFRGQLNYNHIRAKHTVNAIAGFETRSSNSLSDRNRFYGYNDNLLNYGNIDYVNPYPSFISGNMSYIDNRQYAGERTTRFVSLFANAAYTYNNKYTLSASARRDASNLFGLKTNDQWNPFWSVGAAWNISNENFYTQSFIPYLKLRATYGFNGNINPAMVAVNTIRYNGSISTFTGLPTAIFDNYYNPDLRWETIGIFNLGLDFATRNSRISGSIEYFNKKGDNIFGVAPIDYTTGLPSSIIRNAANISGNGFDLQIKSLNIDHAFSWSSILNLSMSKEKVTKYYLNKTLGNSFIGNSSSVPVSALTGKPVYSIFAFPSAGLNPQTGDPRGYVEGKVSEDYVNIVYGKTKIGDMKYFGSAIPTVYGSFIHSFSYSQFSLNFSFVYKLGYWFRRPSIDYTRLMTTWDGHGDYEKRWKQPGDELHTSVPSNTYTTNYARDAFYTGSEELVERADHIRVDYINLDYSFDPKQLGKLPFKSLQFYVNVKNLGTIWKSNKNGIDPDYKLGLVPPVNYTFGFKANL